MLLQWTNCSVFFQNTFYRHHNLEILSTQIRCFLHSEQPVSLWFFIYSLISFKSSFFFLSFFLSLLPSFFPSFQKGRLVCCGQETLSLSAQWTVPYWKFAPHTLNSSDLQTTVIQAERLAFPHPFVLPMLAHQGQVLVYPKLSNMCRLDELIWIKPVWVWGAFKLLRPLRNVFNSSFMFLKGLFENW